MNYVICFSLSIFMLSLGSSVHSHVTTTTRCEYYNETSCRESPNKEDCFKMEECEQPEPGKRNHCFVLWQNGTDKGDGKTDGKFYIKLKGCFLNNIDCYDKRQCIEKREPKKFLMFCCCEGDMCNKNFTWEPISTTAPTHSQEPIQDENVQYVTRLLLLTMVPLFTFIFVLSIFLLIYRHKKRAYFNEIPTVEPHPLPSDSPLGGLRPIQLLEVKGQGRYGAVWKAQFKSETVAVKIQNKPSWLAEQEIFKLERMNHDNILQFLGAEHRGNDNPAHSEYWLITAYHERGSLCDYLKSSTIKWSELCHIAVSMARGLMHLHEEISPSKVEGYKPAVAHRDFKSKNVLLKSDLTACIADFGLALIFEPGKPCGDTHGQVGTRRYMAPEVLEGAINFSRDAFLRIDMYACGLVLWELASRCKAQDGPIPEYQLPFEEEVGQYPTLEDMQECVVQKKQRPNLKETWKKHSGLIALCDTMEECWDHDAEARLSASCVVERLTNHMRSQLYVCGTAAVTAAPDSVGIGKESAL